MNPRLAVYEHIDSHNGGELSSRWTLKYGQGCRCMQPGMHFMYAPYETLHVLTSPNSNLEINTVTDLR